MLIKEHKSYRNVVAVCDKNLLGKKFEEGIRQLEIKDNFFNGFEVEEKEAIRILQSQRKEDATFNIVGEKSIDVAIKAGIISRNNILLIQEIPFALVLL